MAVSDLLGFTYILLCSKLHHLEGKIHLFFSKKGTLPLRPHSYLSSQLCPVAFSHSTSPSVRPIFTFATSRRKRTVICIGLSSVRPSIRLSRVLSEHQCGRHAAAACCCCCCMILTFPKPTHQGQHRRSKRIR